MPENSLSGPLAAVAPTSFQQLYPAGLDSAFGAIDLSADTAFAPALSAIVPGLETTAVTDLAGSLPEGDINAAAGPGAAGPGAAGTEATGPEIDPPIDVLPDLTGLTNQPLIGIIDTGFPPDILTLGSVVFLGSDRIDADSNPLVLLEDSVPEALAPEMLALETVDPSISATISGYAAEIVAAPDGAEPLWLGRADGLETWAASLIEFVDTSIALGFDSAVVSLNVDLVEPNIPGLDAGLDAASPDTAVISDPALDVFSSAADTPDSVVPRSQLTLVEQVALNYARQNNVLIVLPAGDTTSPSSFVEATLPFDNVVTVGSAPDTPPLSYGDGIDLLTSGEKLAPALEASISVTEDGSTSAASTSTVSASADPLLAPHHDTESSLSSSAATGEGDFVLLPSAVLAAARVTSAIAQIWSVNPDLSTLQVIDTLVTTALPTGVPPNLTPEEPDDAPLLEPGRLDLETALATAPTLEGEIYLPEPIAFESSVVFAADFTAASSDVLG